MKTFRSLGVRNYRIWAGGALMSFTGSWMQRTAQDWIVLTELTHNKASAVGIVIGLQFAPQILLLPLTGHAADHFDRRKLLIATQSTMAALALGLGLLTVAGLVQLWHVYVFALLLGCAAAFDAPASQAFVSELVGEADITNAISLNSTSFHIGRMIGPAVAGVLIGMIGSGWAFLLNAGSFVAMIVALLALRTSELHPSGRVAGAPRSRLADGLRYVLGRADLRTVTIMLFLIGTFGLNFPIFISTMSVSVFHQGAGRYGLLTSIMAVGSVAGALLAAGWDRPRFLYVIGSAGLFGAGFAVAAIMPDYWLFGAALVVVGAAAQIFTKAALSWVQLSTAPAIRGRVMALVLAATLGGAPIGAPITGWVADRFGARWAIAIAAAAGIAAALVALRYVRRHKGADALDPAAF